MKTLFALVVSLSALTAFADVPSPEKEKGRANVYGPPPGAMKSTLVCPAGAKLTSSFNYQKKLAFHRCVQSGADVGVAQVVDFEGRNVVSISKGDAGISCTGDRMLLQGTEFEKAFANCPVVPAK